MPQILSISLQVNTAIIQGMDFLFIPNQVKICQKDDVNDPSAVSPTILEWTDDRILVSNLGFENGSYWFVIDQNGMPNLDGFFLQLNNRSVPLTGWKVLKVYTKDLEL